MVLSGVLSSRVGDLPSPLSGRSGSRGYNARPCPICSASSWPRLRSGSPSSPCAFPRR